MAVLLAHSIAGNQRLKPLGIVAEKPLSIYREGRNDEFARQPEQFFLGLGVLPDIPFYERDIVFGEKLSHPTTFLSGRRSIVRVECVDNDL
jgi:hypothetical protein